ncbi:MAG: hypothetical protein ACXABU_09830 [Candidatus Hodarchaeales archaeon]|jgi:hypothetical protein
MKISCDAKCERCYHEKGRRQDLDVNDLVLFCPSCKRVYLCEIGLARIGSEYYCPFDNTIVIKEEVDKSIIQMKGIPGKNQAASEEMYHRLVGGKEEKKQKSGFGLKRGRGTTILSAYHHSKVSELNDITNLNHKLILEVAQDQNISNVEKLGKIKSKKELLDRLGQKNHKILDYLYSALFNFEDVPKALEIRFAVFAPSVIPDIKSIQIADPTLKSDIQITNSQGRKIWAFCSDSVIDLPDIDKYIEKAKEINYIDYPLVTQIYFISKKFTYVAKGMLAKFQSAFTGIEQMQADGTVDVTRSIPLSLWEPIPRQIAFKNVSFV